jgi:anti-sigma B factor antagonist
MTIKITELGGNAQIRVDGDIDADAGNDLTASFQRVVSMEKVRHAIIDMRNVQTTTSSGIGKLMNFYKAMAARGASIEIKGISDSLYAQFMEIHLERIFPISRE